MRNTIIIVLVLVSMNIDFLTAFLPLESRMLGYVVDLLIVIASIPIFARLIANGTWALIPPGYIVVFTLFCFVCLAGLLLNGVSGDTFVAGARMFFRCVPIFLLPFAFNYSAEDRDRLIKLFLWVMVLQIPVTIWQRFYVFNIDILETGDVVRGTLGSSSSVSLLACIAILFLMSAYLTGRMNAVVACLLSILLLIPPSIAETKVTPIALLLGLSAVLWVLRERIRMVRVVPLFATATIGVVMFASVYSLLYSGSDDVSYIDRITDERRNYHFKDAEIPDLSLPRRTRPGLITEFTPETAVTEEVGRLGRIDSVVAPFEALLPNSPMHLMLGVGIGNASSDFGSGGDYVDFSTSLSSTQHTLSHLIWETGVCGALAFVSFLVLLTGDLLRIARRQLVGSPGQSAAILGTTAIIWLCLLYTNLMYRPELLVFFYFLAGSLVAGARRMTISTRSFAAHGDSPMQAL